MHHVNFRMNYSKLLQKFSFSILCKKFRFFYIACFYYGKPILSMFLNIHTENPQFIVAPFPLFEWRLILVRICAWIIHFRIFRFILNDIYDLIVFNLIIFFETLHLYLCRNIIHEFPFEFLKYFKDRN